MGAIRNETKFWQRYVKNLLQMKIFYMFDGYKKAIHNKELQPLKNY